MTNREMLELAAKAAGLYFKWRDGDPKWGPEHVGPAAWVNECWQAWNPLTDDGDEARLEAALGLNVEWQTQHVIVGRTMLDKWQEPYLLHDCDKQAARRFAGVRAAAGIGKSMEGKNA